MTSPSTSISTSTSTGTGTCTCACTRARARRRHRGGERSREIQRREAASVFSGRVGAVLQKLIHAVRAGESRREVQRCYHPRGGTPINRHAGIEKGSDDRKSSTSRRHVKCCKALLKATSSRRERKRIRPFRVKRRPPPEFPSHQLHLDVTLTAFLDSSS